MFSCARSSVASLGRYSCRRQDCQAHPLRRCVGSSSLWGSRVCEISSSYTPACWLFALTRNRVCECRWLVERSICFTVSVRSSSSHSSFARTRPAMFRCVDPVLTIAACLSYRSPFFAPLDKRDEARAYVSSVIPSFGDPLARVPLKIWCGGLSALGCCVLNSPTDR